MRGTRHFSSRVRGRVALVAGLALVLAACNAVDDEPEAVDDVEDVADDGAAPDFDTVDFDIGVTEEPCPDEVHVNPGNGCIYMGQVVDLTVGPLASLGRPQTEGANAFWRTVNERGGIGGMFDVDVETFTRDDEYNPEVNARHVRDFQPDVLAVSQTLGTPTTLGALDIYEEHEMLGVAMTLWSGWEVTPNMLSTSAPYCLAAMNAVDWAVGEHDPETAAIVFYPGDYGGDNAVGARQAFEEQGIEVVADFETGPNAVVGNQDGVISGLLREDPDIVVLAVTEAETAEIVGTTVARGFEGQFLGSIPTWGPGHLEGPAADAFIGHYVQYTHWGPWQHDSPGHEAMRDAHGEGVPDADSYVNGWVLSYPMLAVLEHAVDQGDLTRAGLMASVVDVVVDYEGMMPDRTFSRDNPNDVIPRESIINAPDPDSPVGVSLAEDFYVGPTAEAFEFNEPCGIVG